MDQMIKFLSELDHSLDPCIFQKLFYNCTHKQYWSCSNFAEVCALEVFLLFIVMYFYQCEKGPFLWHLNTM